MIFKQITTGIYTYTNGNGEQEQSHSLYGINENGVVCKWIPKKCAWIELEETCELGNKY